MSSIFDNKSNALGTGMFFSFKNIGDKIEGTYVGTGMQVSKINGEEQLFYRLKGADGQYWKVGSRKGIDSQMKGVKLGQIIGFEYVADKDVKKPSPAKIIQVWANPNIVDTQWLKEQEEAAAAVNASVSQAEPVKPISAPASQATTPVSTASPVEKFQDQPFHTQMDKQEMLDIIIDMAKAKLGLPDNVPMEELKEKVMQATGVAFIDAQLVKIMDSLDKLPNRVG